MCSRSTSPVSSCSVPIGRCTATERSESCVRNCSSAREKSARSRSSMFTDTTRGRPSDSARFQTRLVCTSTPITALATRSVPSTTRKAATVSPAKPASPGVSIRLILRPCHSRWQIEEASDIRRRCSSSSQSEVVVPPSTVPRRLIAPAWKSIASTSDVFPVPRCPVTATLRILPGSVGIAGDSSWKSAGTVEQSYRRAERHIRGAACETTGVAAIEFDSVSKVYDDGTQAVFDLDLAIEDGELMVVVGPSGCGKTTALRMLAGLEEISGGEIKIGDRVVNDLTPKDRDIAMVFQNYALYPHMTVE